MRKYIDDKREDVDKRARVVERVDKAIKQILVEALELLGVRDWTSISMVVMHVPTNLRVGKSLIKRT